MEVAAVERLLGLVEEEWVVVAGVDLLFEQPAAVVHGVEDGAEDLRDAA